MIEVRPLTDENLADAEAIVSARFPREALDVLRKEMRNPLRWICSEVGDIAYEDGRPIAFQAVVLRRLYFKQQLIIGHVSGLAAVLKDASFKSLMMVRKAAHQAQTRRGAAKIRFGNTHCASTAQLATVMKREVGPESCAEYCWQVVSRFRAAIYFIRRKVLRLAVPSTQSVSTLDSLDFSCSFGDIQIKRLGGIEPEFFDYLTDEYVKTNRGLVLSRKAEDLRWIFSSSINSGMAVALSAWKDEKPIGYIILVGYAGGLRWIVRDWFALQDDQIVLETLIKAARHYLKGNTPAMMLTIKGFPMWCQTIIDRNFSHRVKCTVNCFSYNYIDKEFAQVCTKEVLQEKSWFFGPFDGDACF